jgi:hypothetical protein
VLADLHHSDETTTNDKWLKLEAFSKLIYSKFGFNDGIDFTIRELKKAVSGLGPVVSKISSQAGNHTGIHLHEKATKACLTTFILLLSLKDTQPEEPTKGKIWKI